MKKQTFRIPDISCSHCVQAIRNELLEVNGIRRVEGRPEDKTVTVEWEAPATSEKILSALKDMNYPAAN